MTKDRYFELCEMMGNQPKPSEIPVELDDFPIEVQQCFQVYQYLQDNWEAMSGTYLGKNLLGVGELFEIYQIDNPQFALEVIQLIDKFRSEQYLEQQKQADSLKNQKSSP